jgi:glycosyltransferase involved in cell wall biosynthesis
MRIFMLTPYLPYPLLSGGQVRTYNLLKQISKQHEVTLFALIKHEEETEHLKELEKFCKKIRVFRRTSSPWHPKNILSAAFSAYPFVVTRNLVREVKGEIEKELQQSEYDLIHVETFYMMPNIPVTKVPVLLVEQTIEYLGYESFAQKITQKLPFLRPLLYLDIQKIRHWERKYWRSCDQLVAVSEDDKKFIQKVEPKIKDIAVVSNGVDMPFFTEVKKRLSKRPTVLFVGTFNWLPNVEAVEYLVEKVWPYIKAVVPNVQLRIVGSSPTKKIQDYQKQDEQIVVTGRVEDIRTEYAQANVLIAPVFSGKGTRYKVLEAMATETPVIGTSIALEGINAEEGKHCLIADEPEEMAQQAILTLGNKVLQQELGKAGREFVQKNFSWDQISQDLLDIYEKTAK